LAIKRNLILCLASLACVVNHAYSAERNEIGNATAANELYRVAIEEARSSRFEPAIASLRLLVERFPERQDYLGDLAVVLEWSGDSGAALELLGRIDRANAPLYVTESLAISARRLQRFYLAESMYREALVRFPERVELQVGLARTLAEQPVDTSKLEEATALIERLFSKYPRRTDVLEARADIATARRDYFGALASFQLILVQEPAHRAALRGRMQTLSRLGAPQLALDLADRTPGILTSEERNAIAADRTAHQIRWGAVTADTEPGSARFAEIDRALDESEMAGSIALQANTNLTASERQLALDRVGALRERYRMRDAIELYEALAARSALNPVYVKAEAASAYLYLEQPEKARDLYREVLATDPENLGSQIGLFYALAESEDHDAALKQIELTVSTTPQWIDAWSMATLRDNPAYPRVLSARAMAPSLANRPGEAERRLHELSDRIPFNMEVRTDYASSMRARGWPNRAEQELRWILAVDPDNSGALGERAGALLEKQDYAAAESALERAQSVTAEDGRVVRAARLEQVHNMRELIVDGTYGRSGGGPKGTQDHAVDTRLYSSPISYNYRAFAHSYNAEGQFDSGTGRRDRLGVGLEYRSPLMTITGELAHDINNSKSAAAASVAYTPDDFWTVRGEYEESANQTPLQASLAGIDARRVAGEVAWRANESRSAAVSYENLDFSDGNRRDITQARWTERVIAGPVYKLELTGALYASRNSLDAAPYFNPSHDFSPTLEFANEWLQWRRYTRAFRHRLVASAGTYQQAGFGAGAVYDAHYEQEWEADDRLTLRYGVGRSLHPYDGVQSATNYLYFYLNGKF